MSSLLSERGLRYNAKAIARGAQTVRSGKAWPVSGLLAVRNSPAACLITPTRDITRVWHLVLILQNRLRAHLYQ